MNKRIIALFIIVQAVIAAVTSFVGFPLSVQTYINSEFQHDCNDINIDVCAKKCGCVVADDKCKYNDSNYSNATTAVKCIRNISGFIITTPVVFLCILLTLMGSLALVMTSDESISDKF